VIKLLLDQGLPRTAAALLCAAGIDTVHVGEIGYASADDADILQRARDDGRVVVTLDADFHALLALSGATSPSVIRIRIEGLRAAATANLLQTVLSQCDEDLQQGAVVTVQPTRIRVRRLPLLG
jgi:predicted nuclease of predicted toxin-antitoxin system